MAGAQDFELLYNSYLKSAENIITHFDDNKDLRNELLEQLEKCARKTCFHSLRAKKVADTVKDVSRNIDKNSNTKEIMKSFSEEKQRLIDYEPDPTEHPFFKDYCQQTKALVNNADGIKQSKLEDDDIEMTQSAVNVIDPFTKKRMTDPVRNKVCGHIYDRESVTCVLERNKNTKCPVIGCSNKDPILLENMISDLITRKYLHDNPS